MLAGGDEHPFHGNIRHKDFDDFHYPRDVPKEAFKDIARSDRESLRDAVEEEYQDHADGKSGGGLFHAINATAAAAAHWGAKQAKRGQELHARFSACLHPCFEKFAAPFADEANSCTKQAVSPLRSSLGGPPLRVGA